LIQHPTTLRFKPASDESRRVPQMTKLTKTSVVAVGAIAILVTAASYALFHGYFDHGQFEMKQFQWSATNQVAMVAERSHHEALGGLEYYVLIGNHLFTPAELRHAYYSDAVVFNASSNCLTLHWDGPNRLTIRCNGSVVDRNHINAQRQQIGDIAISYENIAVK
jgi:hypothetical protein